MKTFKFLALGLCALLLLSCDYKQSKPRAEASKVEIPMSCDTADYSARYWLQEDTSYLFLSIHCFSVEPNDSTYLLGWDPKTFRTTKMEKNFVYPDQTGNAGKVLMTDGNDVYWGDLPTP
jgi:hypothetical protein